MSCARRVAVGSFVAAVATLFALTFAVTAAVAAPSEFRLGEITGHFISVNGVAITPDGEIITAGEDGYVYGWDPATFEQRWSREVGDEFSMNISFAMRADGELLAASDDMDAMTAWVRKDQKLSIFNHELAGSPKCLAMSPDGHWIAAGCDKGLVILFDAEKWYAGGMMEISPGNRKEPIKVSGDVVTVAFSPDGNTLAATVVDDNAQRKVVLLNVRERREFRQLDTNGAALAFSKSGRSLCAGVTVYDTVTWQPRYRLDYPFEVRAAVFAPDGAYLLTGGNDNRLVFWNGSDGRKLAALRAHDDVINSVATSADGRVVVSGSNDATARVWNAQAILAKRPVEEPFAKLADKRNLFACWRLGGEFGTGVLSLQPDGKQSPAFERALKLAEQLKVKLPAAPAERPVPVGQMMSLAEEVGKQIRAQYGETPLEIFQLAVLLHVFRDFYDTKEPKMSSFAEQVLPSLREGLLDRYGAAPTTLDAVETAVKEQQDRAHIDRIFGRLIREIDVYLKAQAAARGEA